MSTIRTLANARMQLGRRYRQLRKLWSAEGGRGLVKRVLSTAAERWVPAESPMPVDRRDILAADLANPPARRNWEVLPPSPLTLNWIVIPAAPKSGGHTTAFRLIRYLEEHGYQNRLYFYNVYGADHAYYESIVRSYYGFHGPVGRIEDGMEDSHGVVATGWGTAYPAFNSPCSGKRFYLVQDYEPSFYPVGAVSQLAETTYRMGFHGITAGKWLAKKMREEFSMPADSFEFGCDTSVYHFDPAAKRSGVVFYARPEAARRGFELGVMAMEIFAHKHPETGLHFYGDSMGHLPFRFINHGRVTPDELNAIYNRCYAGLSLSLTNVSLVPHEMLAAGCIPVVNDAEHNRLVLDNPYVTYAAAHPHALSAALEDIVFGKKFDTLSRNAASSVHGITWDDAGATVDRAIRSAFGQRVPELEGTFAS